MFLNPTIRNKLLQKKDYMVDQRDNTFVTKIIDDRIYLQEYDTDNKPTEYKNVHFKEKKKKKKKKTKKKYNKDIVEEESEKVEEESENVEEEEKVEASENTDLYGGDALEEQKNIKTVIVHSFF